MQRRAMTAVALTLGGLSAPMALSAQRGPAPGPDTPRLLVAVFFSPDRATGVQAADAIRSRMTSDFNIKQLYVIPKNDITATLESSGYRPDSALGQTDLKELAKLLRADEIIAGTATRAASGGWKIEPRLLLARDVTLAQPLPAIEANTPSDAARPIQRALAEARKQLADNRACENGIRANEFDKAIAAAKAGIDKYPNATLARLCLASAFAAMKAAPDSVLRVTDEIRKLDPKNSFALRLAYGAYQQKNDGENAVRALVSLMALEPGNPTLQNSVVTELAKLGKPEIALPIIDTLLTQNPGDPQLLRQRWLLSLAAASSADSSTRSQLFGNAVKAGEEMVQADTMFADSVYFSRQIIAANAMVPQRGLEFASKAVQKYPGSAEFWMLKGNAERKAGQLQMAQQSVQRALSIEPKYQNGNLLLASIYVDLNQPDSAVAVARRAVAGGEDAKTWGAFMLGPTQTAFKAAQESKKTEDYQRALTLAQESDKLSPSATAKFFIGVASFSIGIDALQQAQVPIQAGQKTESKTKKADFYAKGCPLAKQAQEMMLLTQINMPAGGTVDANTAKQILGYVAQYAPAADQMAKVACK